MNRRKKAKQIFNAKQKKANAKLTTHTKPKYISKAERAKLADLDNAVKSSDSHGL